MTYKIDLEWEQVDAIVVKELQYAYVNGDDDVADAAKVLLQYYMAPSDYEQWSNENVV